MRQFFRTQIKETIQQAGEKGATAQEIGTRVGLERHTLSKYLSLMEKEGELAFRQLGKARLWFINKQPLEKLSKTHEGERSATERLVIQLMNQIPIGIIVIDSNMEVHFTNQTIESRYGNILGKKLDESVLTKNSRAGAEKIVSTLNESGLTRSFRAKDMFGNVMRFKTIRMENPDKKTSILLLVRNINAKAMAEERLRASEKVYKTIGELIPFGIWICDATGNPTFISDSFLKLLGLSLEEYKLKRWVDSINPGERKKADEKWAKCVSNGTEWSYIHHVAGTDQKIYTILSKGIPIRDKEGHIIYWAGINLDITDHDLYQSKLEESERRYRAIVEDQSELVVRSLPNGIISFANNAYCKYFGKTREELVGKPFMPHISPEDREPLLSYLAALTLEHPVSSIEHRAIKPNGEVRWQHWNDRAIFDQNGIIIEYQSVGRDVTTQKVAEHERTTFFRQLQRLLEENQNRSSEMEAIFSALTEPIIIYDATEKIINANRAAVESLGFDPIGKDARFIVEHNRLTLDGKRPVKETEIISKRALKGETIQNFTYHSIDKKGIKHVVISSAAPIKVGTRITGAVLSWHDVTKHKDVQELLDQSKKKQAKKKSK